MIKHAIAGLKNRFVASQYLTSALSHRMPLAAKGLKVYRRNLSTLAIRTLKP
ncbi:hypothetical protein [Coleofasciculus chthonoplastes]|uniref:hypothetical protein n=1 Tax=Coleofasciculus chthonoplastes TaxID=64178 RepID=UPI0012F90BCE|nr:hypothetical protein [Coleofasciculus chthonoplastes]